MRKAWLWIIAAVAINAILAIAIIVSAEEPAEHGQPHQEDDTSFPPLTAFHEVVAEMWHVHFPANDWAAVRKTAPQLVEKMNALKQAPLPVGLAAKNAAYQPKLAALQAAVDALVKAAAGTDDQALKQAVIDMHHAYHAVVVTLAH